MKTRSCHLLASPETTTTLVHAGGTELLQMSWSIKQGMRCKLVL